MEQDFDLESIRTAIASELLTEEEVDILFENKVGLWEKERADQKITLKSVLFGVVGRLIGAVVGGIMWGFMMIGLGQIFYLFGIGLLVISYFFV